MRKLLVLTVLILSSMIGNIGTKSAHAKKEVKTRTTLVTAYCLRGRMANGRYVHYGAVATHPRQYPRGTRFWIPGYGRGVAEDTGGAVGWDHIDIWMPSCRSAIRWGTRYLRVRVY